MIGSEGVAKAVVTKLQSRMPAKLAELRQRLSTPELAVDMVQLPEIQRWVAHDLDELEVGGFPVILVTEVESTGQLASREVDYGMEADAYTDEYVMRVFCWAMGDSAGGTMLMLKRYVLAIREILLYEKLLYSGADGEEYAKVNPRFIKHSYADSAVDGARQVLAGGYVEIHVSTRELLAAPAKIIMDGPLSPTVTVSTDTTLI